MLILDGRRSIHAAWPPQALCESCGLHEEGGYVGPVVGNDVTYPAPETGFVCRSCARSGLGLGESDWSGHQCRSECRDTEHLDWTLLPRDELVDATAAERMNRFADDYATRGWTVLSVAAEPQAPRTVGGRYWAIWFRPTRLPW